MNRTKRFLLVALVLSSALAGKEFCAAQTAHQDSARQLVDRQARAWEKQDFTLAASEWLPTAARSPPKEIISPDGKKLAIEWDWAVTRKRDGKRGTSHDAIIVDLTGGKIASLREYYDPASSVEANP